MRSTRLPTDLCLLCQVRPADKTNSHIIPRFLTKSFFNVRKASGKAIEFSPFSKTTRQDGPKFDYILCSECEKGIAEIEGKIAPNLRKALTDPTIYHPYIRPVFSGDRFATLTLFILDVTHFTAFVYSLFWRSIVSEVLPVDFSRPETALAEKGLREHILKAIRKQTIDKTDKLFKYRVVVAFGDPKWLGLSFAPIDHNRLELIVNDLYMILDLDENQEDDYCLNDGKSKVKIEVMTRESWNKLMEQIQNWSLDHGQAFRYVHPKRNNQ